MLRWDDLLPNCVGYIEQDAFTMGTREGGCGEGVGDDEEKMYTLGEQACWEDEACPRRGVEVQKMKLVPRRGIGAIMGSRFEHNTFVRCSSNPPAAYFMNII